MNIQKIADDIQALKLHPASSEEYDAGYQAARHDAWLIAQEAAEVFDRATTRLRELAQVALDHGALPIPVEKEIRHALAELTATPMATKRE